jgi:FkbM family methyltransferase
MSLRKIINAVARPLGYELVRMKHLGDAYKQQEKLLADREVRTIFDVGANIGQTAEKYRELFPAATIWSFEPFEGAFRELSERMARDGNVRPVNSAVADTVGTRRFYISRASQMNSLLSTAEEGPLHMGGRLADVVDEAEVPVTTLDAFTAEQGIEQIDILKMDIQGGELLALRGADGLLKRRAIDMVYCEVSFVKLYEQQGAFDEVWRHLEGYEYSLYGLYNLSYSKFGFLGFGDALFVSPRFSKGVLREDEGLKPKVGF